MKMKSLFPILATMTLTLPALALPKNVTGKTLSEIVQSNLKFVLSEQVQSPNKYYGAGEWPSQIQSSALPRLVGVGRFVGVDEEASAFTTAVIANTLASMYLDLPQLQTTATFQKIPAAMNAAVESFERFSQGPLYNFYPAREWKGTVVRQPIDMNLAPWWKGLTNVPEDADTTSVVYAAKALNAKLHGETYSVPAEALASLQKFRDIERKAHFYNRGMDHKNTGAFLTWQMDEKSPEMPHMYFADPKEGTRIPFNRNDVDCIVNTNVVRMLEITKSSDVAGKAEACELLNKMIKKEESPTCGIYYPNTFNLAYAVGELEKTGSSCIRADKKTQLVEYILKHQNPDGSWDNVKNTWKDRVQSTAFALTALLEIGNGEDHRVDASIRYGVQYLLKNMVTSDEGDLHFKGETFFTATAIARSLIIWKSDAYTTVLAANVFAKVAAKYPQYTVEYFEKLN